MGSWSNPQRSKPGKIDSSAFENAEKKFLESGGRFKEFELSDLFEIRSSKKIFHAQNIEIFENQKKGTFPYVVRSTLNNGIRGYISEGKSSLNPGNTLSFAQDTFSVFYQKQPFYTGNKVKVLVPKFENFNRELAISFAADFQKVLESFTWGKGSTVDTISRIKITLPVKKSGEIAFNYMEERIKELEHERIKELEAYLQITGLRDYQLSAEENRVLAEFNDLIENPHTHTHTD